MYLVLTRVSYRHARAAQITTDAARVRQIVTNGLTNALKYAPPGVWGPVRVVVRRAAAHGTAAAAGPSHISIEVLDAGPGLRGQSEEVLFADFASHVPATRTGAVGSSGLGLAICNRMARLLGGELHLHDRADGVSGTRFVLTLPVPDAAAAGAAALQNSPGSALVAGPARLSHGVVGVPAAPGSGVEGAGGGVPSPRQLGAIRVVVIDDGGAAAHVPDGVAPPAAAAGGLVSAGAAAAVATASEAPAAAGAAAGGGAAPAGATAMGLHVLLVDDSVGNRRVGGRMLQQLGCKGVLATDGDEVRARALQLQLQRHRVNIYDVISALESVRDLIDSSSATCEFMRCAVLFFVLYLYLCLYLYGALRRGAGVMPILSYS